MASQESVSVEQDLYPLVLQLQNADQREQALLEMSKKRESFADLAPILWYCTGTITVLIQEITAIYPMLSPPTLSPGASNRVCNALALLQCVASHPDTKSKFMEANIPLYLYPFLSTVSRHRPFEYLRLTSLGVIGALVKVDDTDVVSFLLQTEIIPLCLRIMETGSELSKTVATFVVQKILLDETGLSYVCATAERFHAVSNVLGSMVTKLLESPSVRLLKHIVRCYWRLSENQKARDALRTNLPEALRDNSFAEVLRTEEVVQRWLQHLLINVNEGTGGAPAVGAGVEHNSNNPMHDPASGADSTGGDVSKVDAASGQLQQDQQQEHQHGGSSPRGTWELE
jgi:CCR4-NOT transcription complex subunit 9